MKLERIALSVFLLCGLAHADDAAMAPRAFDNYEKPIFSPSWRYPSSAEVKPATSPPPPGPTPSPSFPTIPPISPCSATASCAPGVGLESGVTIKSQDQLQKIDTGVQQ
jgi:hypothetical protein